MKKAFSIIELIISIALIALMFGLYISKENIIPNFKGKEIRLETLKMDLISAFPFEKSLRLVCTNKDLQCFVVVDGIIENSGDSILNCEMQYPPSSSPKVECIAKLQTQIK